jgi:hypothetical protein
MDIIVDLSNITLVLFHINQYIKNYDKPPILTNYLYGLYKQPAKNWSLSESSIKYRG